MIDKVFKIELIYRIHDKDCPNRNRFDKKLRFMEAQSEREAYQNALLAATKELEKLNDSFPTLKWEFIGLEAFKAIAHRDSDKELHYTIENDDDAFEYVRQLRFKNNSLQLQIAQTA